MTSVSEWPAIKDRFHGAEAAILVGNGASRAVSESFSYSSLFEVAEGMQPGLRPADIEIFQSLGTRSFERTLAALRLAERALLPLSKDATKLVSQHYKSIREALAEAIHKVHIESSSCGDELVFLPMARELAEYGSVYSTNYDLLIYWAINKLMETEANNRLFYDHFLNGDFEAKDYVGEAHSAGQMRTRVLFLHGALHLYTGDDGKVHKLQRSAGRGLLQLSSVQASTSDTPLFVAEGSPRDKVHAIRQSEYLDFALRQYDDFEGPLVVFGQRLDDSDHHLLKPHVERAQDGRKMPVAVSVRQSGKSPVALADELRRYRDRLHPLEPVFFEATTHPLGNPHMSVDER